jgi:hypothetical protein
LLLVGRKEFFKIEKVRKEDEERVLSTQLSTFVESAATKVITESERIRASRMGDGLSRIRNNSFHSEFILFRRTLQLKKILRKTRIDSLLKKCKSKVFRTIQEAINLLTGLSNSKDNRLPQSFITNINIDYNKKYLNKSLEEIYKECKVIHTVDELAACNAALTEEERKYLNALLAMTHREAFEAYIKSNRYQSDYNYIKQREGEKYAILFDYVAKIYVRYFLNGRGNKKRNQRKNFHGRDLDIRLLGKESLFKLKMKSRKKRKIVFRTY